MCGSLVFCALVFLPLCARIFHFAPEQQLGEAAHTPLPPLRADAESVSELVKTLRQGWLDKNFAFRGHLVRWYSYYVDVRFNSAVQTSPVVQGEHGWLYLARDKGISMAEEFSAIRPLTREQMEVVADLYRERREWLRQRGIRHLVMVPPNKETIHPEHLPASFTRVGTLARLDQLMDYLRQNTDLDILDLRESLLAAKAKGDAFYATDSHWNAHGAFSAYRTIVERLRRDFPALRPMSEDDFFIARYPFIGGDLPSIMGMQGLYNEGRILMLPKSPMRARGESTGRMLPGYMQPALASRVDDPSLPRAVFFHDSYFWEIHPFLAEHFSRAVYAWVVIKTGGHPLPFDKDLVEKEHPDVVVEEIAERFFVAMASKYPLPPEAGEGAK